MSGDGVDRGNGKGKQEKSVFLARCKAFIDSRRPVKEMASLKRIDPVSRFMEQEKVVFRKSREQVPKYEVREDKNEPCILSGWERFAQTQKDIASAASNWKSMSWQEREKWYDEEARALVAANKLKVVKEEEEHAVIIIEEKEKELVNENEKERESPLPEPPERNLSAFELFSRSKDEMQHSILDWRKLPANERKRWYQNEEEKEHARLKRKVVKEKNGGSNFSLYFRYHI